MTTKTIFNTLTALAVAATLTVGLAACAPTAEPAPVEKPTATAPAVETVEGDTDGDGKLSGWESEMLAKSTYLMPDGTKAQLPSEGPIPAEIEEAVVATFDANWDGSSGGSDFGYVAALKSEQEKLHRLIITVGFGFDGMKQRNVWAIGGHASGSFETMDDKAAAVAAAHEYTGGDYTKFAVIVID